MQNNISITLLTPHMTCERYCEVTGINPKTLELMLSDGRLSAFRHRLRKDGGRELTLINVAALTADALSSFHEIGNASSKAAKTTRRKPTKSS